MNCLAIIIKGYSESREELVADRKYVDYYKTFLSGTAGGAWEAEEILSLEEPTLQRLEILVDQRLPEFVLLIMVGHGATQSSRQLFKINKTTIIKAGQLALDVNKQLVILESCRTEIKKIKTVDLKDRIGVCGRTFKNWISVILIFSFAYCVFKCSAHYILFRF